MDFLSLFFYIFAFVTVASGLMVIMAKNMVHSVLFLILTFVSSAGLFMLLGAEFLAMILIVVYVGAVAILFLFVVMMLDIDLGQFKEGFLQYLPVGVVVGLILLVELVLVAVTGFSDPVSLNITGSMPVPDMATVSNTEALGNLLYTRYIYFFQAAGLILLVAMVGAILLTLHHKSGVKRQVIADQVARKPEDAIELTSPEPGKGIS